MISCVGDEGKVGGHDCAEDWEGCFGGFLEELAARLELFVLVLFHD